MALYDLLNLQMCRRQLVYFWIGQSLQNDQPCLGQCYERYKQESSDLVCFNGCSDRLLNCRSGRGELMNLNFKWTL